MADFMTMDALDLAGRRVMVRTDMNVPLRDGRISDDYRIRACLPTIRRAMEQDAAVILLSHLGRPDGCTDPAFSLRPVAGRLSEILGLRVPLVEDYTDGITVAPGEVVLCENLRFHPGEKGDDETFARKLAALCDVFVMDAFGCAHRAHASTHGAIRFAGEACAGRLLAKEITELQGFLHDIGPAATRGRRRLANVGLTATTGRRRLAIVGGAKVSGKLEVLESLSDKVDTLIVGGGIANTFIAAAGYKVGKSLYEPKLIPQAQALCRKMEARGARLVTPLDGVCARSLSERSQPVIRELGAVCDDEMILDVGPRTIDALDDVFRDADAVLWNGPLGAFEHEPFKSGTMALAQHVVSARIPAIIGGGDTIAALFAMPGFSGGDGRMFLSTGGGAFLEFIAGRKLPALEALTERARAGRHYSQDEH